MRFTPKSLPKVCQNPEGKANFLVDEVLMQVKSREVLAGRDPSHDMFRLEVLFRNDHGPTFLRVLGENVEPAGYLTDHLLDLIAESRTDELEDEFQEKSQKYRDAIQEVTQCENAIHELGLSKEAKKTIDRYVSAVGHRWVLCGDYLYKSGMRDILRLLENR